MVQLFVQHTITGAVIDVSVEPLVDTGADVHRKVADKLGYDSFALLKLKRSSGTAPLGGSSTSSTGVSSSIDYLLQPTARGGGPNSQRSNPNRGHTKNIRWVDDKFYESNKIKK